jgi:eukaryotic-like serine/threonine-protein kinase
MMSKLFGLIKKEREFILITLGVFFGGLLILAIIFDNFVMPMVVHHGAEFSLPNVVGNTLMIAQKKIEEKGLQLDIAAEEFDPTHPKGTVIFQVPESGSNVKKGMTIRVTISKGVASSTVPNLRGISLREAKLMVENAGLQMGEIVWYSDEGFPDGVVIESNPKAGVVVKFNTEIQLVVNQLETQPMVIVPSFVGLDLAEAKKKAEESNVLIGQINSKKDDRMLPETVLSQSVAPGTKVNKWTEINLTVSQSE